MTVERVSADGDDVRCQWFIHENAPSTSKESFHRELLELLVEGQPEKS